MSSTSDNNANSTREKKPLKFVSEGVGNVEAQRIREQVEQKNMKRNIKGKPGSPCEISLGLMLLVNKNNITVW